MMFMSEGVILLVEDNPSDAALLSDAFEQWGVANPMRVVKDGNEAIEYLEGTGDYRDREQYPMPSLVLLDLNLVQLSGFGALGWIRSREERDTLPVVLLTGTEDPMDLQRAYQLGANSFLIKTGNLEELRKRLNDVNEMVLLPKFPQAALRFGA